MPVTLHYGAASSLQFPLPESALLSRAAQSPTIPVGDVAAAVRQALAHPLGLPSLAQCVVPGDRVTLALAPGLPCQKSVVDALVGFLVEAGLAANDITVLHAEADSLLPLLAPDLSVVLHNPSDRDQLAYLAADEAGEAIYLNRAICDADVVLPVGMIARQNGKRGELRSELYPRFSDAKAQQRLRLAEHETQRSKERRHLAAPLPSHQADWLVGVQFTVQIVPGGGDQILRVLAGAPDEVDSVGRELYETTWRRKVQKRASLVVAAITGDAREQTWENVGRALHSGTQAVADGGAIVICCELADAPGPAVQLWAAADHREALMRRIRKERPNDASAALALEAACQRATVYLLSKLDDSLVEDLGLAPVVKAEDVVRLASRHESCILIRDAHRMQVSPPCDEQTARATRDTA